MQNRHPKYTLASVKTHRGLEGPGLRATLVRASDKVKIVEVYDEGSGGCFFYERTYNAAAFKEFEAYVGGLTLTYTMDGKTHTVDTERNDWVINEIYEDYANAKAFARTAAKKAVFTVKGDPANVTYRSLNITSTRQEAHAWIRAKFGDKATILA